MIQGGLGKVPLKHAKHMIVLRMDWDFKLPPVN